MQNKFNPTSKNRWAMSHIPEMFPEKKKKQGKLWWMKIRKRNKIK